MPRNNDIKRAYFEEGLKVVQIAARIKVGRKAVC